MAGNMNDQEQPTSHPAPEKSGSRDGGDVHSFIEELLHTIARAKVRVSLYPESHPQVQTLLQELDGVVRKVLEGKTVLSLEFQPGRIVINGEHVVSEKEMFARFSQEMYRRRIAGIEIDRSLDLSSLFRFLKYISTDVETLYQKSEDRTELFPELTGIRIEQVDYGRLAGIGGQSLDTEISEEEAVSTLELLYGKQGAMNVKGAAITKYLPLSENLVRALEEVSGRERESPAPDADLPADRQAATVFRNIVDVVYTLPEARAVPLKSELSDLLYQMPDEMRAEVLIEELMDKGKGGNLFHLFHFLTESEMESVLTPITSRVSSDYFTDLVDKMKQIREAIRGHLDSGESRRERFNVDPESIAGEAFMSSLKDSFHPTNVSSHFNQLVLHLFNKSKDPSTVEHCLKHLGRDLLALIEGREWGAAKHSIQTNLSILDEKEFSSNGISSALVTTLKNDILQVMGPIMLGSLEQDDEETIGETVKILELLQITPQEVFLDLLAGIEERVLRKKVITFAVNSGEIPESTLKKMLDHDQWYVVRNAVTLMKELADPGYLPMLEKTMNHPHERVVQETLHALSRIRKKESLILLYRVFEDTERPSELRAMAMKAMGVYEDPRIREACLVLLQDERNPNIDFDVRMASIKNLGRYKDRITVQFLLEFIKKRHLLYRRAWGELKQAAVGALEEIDTLEARGALLQADKFL